ncbi:hypothetical protein IMG5_107650 [Ichthyophthirius multifiliis]|uniref:Uncharacterized protein n=1 Tax=Ichthyophthirius multifiliis TaxID=5932 RepID=G0QTB0_ICHMU|nr:hypothetical protein IMG5_107650 [Ichthyophthirius multifiliis]EGR31545.1 hypothetical protein IMG5_107650 [Ichthyophthirius multifiliis]|eukprot:XP_004035031.1 hypothetical protein IMG5_107650 [Ichthyophthirius multifiliis]
MQKLKSFSNFSKIQKYILIKIKDLSLNYIEEIENLELPQLEQLYLQGNKIDLLPLFKNVPRLRILDISNNEIKDLNALLIDKSLNYLESINCSYNQLPAQYLEDLCLIIQSMPNLLQLQCTGNEITLNNIYKSAILTAKSQKNQMDQKYQIICWIKYKQKQNLYNFFIIQIKKKKNLKKTKNFEKAAEDTNKDFLQRLKQENEAKLSVKKLLKDQIDLVEEIFQKYQAKTQKEQLDFLECIAIIEKRFRQGNKLNLDDDVINLWKLRIKQNDENLKNKAQLAKQIEDNQRQLLLQKEIDGLTLRQKLYKIALEDPDLWRDLKTKEIQQIYKEEKEKQLNNINQINDKSMVNYTQYQQDQVQSIQNNLKNHIQMINDYSNYDNSNNQNLIQNNNYISNLNIKDSNIIQKSILKPYQLQDQEQNKLQDQEQEQIMLINQKRFMIVTIATQKNKNKIQFLTLKTFKNYISFLKNKNLYKQIYIQEFKYIYLIYFKKQIIIKIYIYIYIYISLLILSIIQIIQIKFLKKKKYQQKQKMDKHKPLGHQFAKKDLLQTKPKITNKYTNVKKTINSGVTVRDVDVKSDRFIAKKKSENFGRIKPSFLSELLQQDKNTESVYELVDNNSKQNYENDNQSITSIYNAEQNVDLNNQQPDFLILDIRDICEYEKYKIKESLPYPLIMIKQDKQIPQLHKYVIFFLLFYLNNNRKMLIINIQFCMEQTRNKESWLDNYFSKKDLIIFIFQLKVLKILHKSFLI